MSGDPPRPGRIGERGSAVVAVLILLAATLLMVGGARHFGGAAAEELRCQGDAVRAIGSGSRAGCGDGEQPASSRGSRLHAGPGSAGASRRAEEPPPADREAREHEEAREMLAPLFEILEDGAEAGAENQLSEDEFEEVVELFDRVREERTSIQFSRRATPYLDAIMADLARILQTVGGRELIGQLARQSEWSLITVAYARNQDGVEDPRLGLDASNASAWYEDSNGYVAYAPGHSVRLPGADLTIYPWAVMRSDVALYHELRHVLDFLADTGNYGYLREDGARVPIMEYQAVGLDEWRDRVMSENAYRAARREIGALGTGAVAGDADMPDRPRYTYRLPPAEPP